MKSKKSNYLHVSNKVDADAFFMSKASLFKTTIRPRSTSMMTAAIYDSKLQVLQKENRDLKRKYSELEGKYKRHEEMILHI